MATEPLSPPVPRTADGRLRRVGVEIEFGGLDALTAARTVRSIYGGRIEEVDRHKAVVHDTPLGAFTVELDARYAHPKDPESEKAYAFPERLRNKLAPTVGDVVSLWLPYEIAAPPVAFDRLGVFDRLVEALRHAGATGTYESPLYAFGLQLNVEVAATDAPYLRRHLQAYLVLSPRLRAEIGIDPTRRLAPFIGQFPAAYVRRVLAPDYAPHLDRLIDDYLAANPTRNRELDLLPLLAHLAPDRVFAVLADPHIKARPTFHYRLPNSRVDEPTWGGVVAEWNRWLQVERLAADADRLAAACRDCLTHASPRDWVGRSLQWIAGDG